ncbi:MAG: type II secretion system F family protein, partial [Candidatus Diapherotrites archaeon]|nr:type II secretion system F family protein [Candidatus Diapherotrites archaeon]
IAFFSMISTALIYYFNIYYAVERRTNYVESILPDFLQLVSSNINAGMSPFNAFRSSARKEFGPLSNEVKIASVKALGTESFSNALTELNKRFDSKALKESISFFAQSISSGGKLSKLLEMTSNDLRQTQEMKKELETSSKLFVLFIGFVVLIGTPMLLSISIQFLELINSIQADTVMPAGNTASLGFLTAELAITPDFMVFISLILLLGNSFLASMFIGVLSSGKPKSGVKYFPLLLIVSVIFFFLARTFLTVFLG